MASIVDEIRNDREKGAKRLESEYKAGLMALARRFCDDESNAEELVNRTFAAVVENIDSYLEQSAFFGWMSKILINLYSKDTRRKSNENEFNCAEIPEGEPDDEACARVFREVDASILREAIDRLPHDMKQTLMMHYFMDMPVLLPSQAFDNRIRKASLRIARQREELNDLIDHDLTGY